MFHNYKIIMLWIRESGRWTDSSRTALRDYCQNWQLSVLGAHLASHLPSFGDLCWLDISTSHKDYSVFDTSMHDLYAISLLSLVFIASEFLCSWRLFAFAPILFCSDLNKKGLNRLKMNWKTPMMRENCSALSIWINHKYYFGILSHPKKISIFHYNTLELLDSCLTSNLFWCV